MIITLLTDFGLADPFVGVMKGVIYGINPEAEVVDLSHEPPAYDVKEAAFLMKCSYRYFPRGTIHVVVVDPGVGSKRRPLLATTDYYYFLAPDNGVLSYLFAADEMRGVIHITATHYFLKPVSATFHGRDIFAPVAAYLSRGIPPTSFGEEIQDWVRLEVPLPRRQANGSLEGEVVRLDRFGNLITSIEERDIAALLGGKSADSLRIKVGEHKIAGLSACFAEGREGQPGAIIGSFGHLEIFVKEGSAAERLGAGRGDRILLELVK